MYRLSPLILGALLAFLLPADPALAAPEVNRLRCEDRIDPLGIDVAKPRFSWTLESGERGDRQTAYQVVVEGTWDSGRVESDQSLHIEYAGPPLDAAKDYLWKVRVWDAAGQAGEYRSAKFSTGIASWDAQWIGRDELPNEQHFGAGKWVWYRESSPQSTAPVGQRHFTKTFTLASAPSFAVVDLAADNGFVVSINGTEIGSGNNFNEPESFEITSHLRSGANTLSVTASNIGDGPNPAGLIARLHGNLPGGVGFEIVTDATWQASKDSANWAAAMVLGDYGMAPWGTLNTRQLPARHLRKDFQTHGDIPISRATAYVCGLGFFDLFLNGEEVSDHVMDPALSNYTKTAYYMTFDVTDRIRNGENAVGLMIGNGRFLAPRFKDPAVTQTFGFPKALVQLEIEYADGSRAKIISDETWKITDQGPIRRNNEFDGEEYDARMELSGWASTGYDDSAWAPAELVASPGGTLKSQIIEPMKIKRMIRPVSVTNPESGKYIVDMGESFYGTVRIKASGAAGTKVNLVSAYSLLPDGNLKTADNRSAKCTDTYIFKGEGVEIWNPRFKGQGFRHVEVTGFPGVPTIENFDGLEILTDVETVGSFSSSHALINETHAALNRGARMFLRSAPLDPDRDERQAWMGDSSKGIESTAYNMNVAAFFTKWMDDVARSQRGDGSIPDVATFWDWGNGVEWPAVFTIIPDWFIDFYGDTRLAETHYGAMKTWVLAMRRHEQPDGTLGATSYGDWCDASTIFSGSNNGATPGNLVSSAYQYHNYRIMERLATLRGNTADQQAFATLAANLKTAFNARFFNPAAAVYQGDTQCAYLLALKFGLAPDSHREAVIANLVDNVMVKNNGHTSVGLIGMQWLMQTLTDIGRSDVAWTIATQTTRPSWGYMFSKGATTIWERWDGDTRDPSMNSESLLILAGNLDAWFYQTLAGIKPASPAFKTFLIQPEILGDLSWAKAEFISPYGKIVSDWKIQSPTALTLNCTVPPNSSATIHVPLTTLTDVTIRENGTVIWENGVFVPGVAGISSGDADERAVRFHVGSGSYAFDATGVPVQPKREPIIVDNDDPNAAFTGSWTRSTNTEADQRYGTSFAYAAAGTGTSQVIFRPDLPSGGHYRVYGRWTTHANRATNTPFTIHHAAGETVIPVNQEKQGGTWNLLGTFRFDPGTAGHVKITNAANEYVIADAVKFEPVEFAGDGSESMLRDSFDAAAPSDDLNSGLAVRQDGFLAPVAWQANANNSTAQSSLGELENGARPLLLNSIPGGVAAGEMLAANLAPATTGKLSIRFDARLRNANGDSSRWLGVSLSSASFGLNPSATANTHAISFLFQANGSARVLIAGVEKGSPLLWTSDSSIAGEITIELADTAGTGSPFAGNGSVARLVDASGNLLGSFALSQMSACHLHFGCHESAWEIDNLDLRHRRSASAFDEWVADYFSNSDDRDPNADPDGDGVSNFAEFALHGNPANSSDRGRHRMIPDSGDRFEYILATRRGCSFSPLTDGPQTARHTADGIVYQVEGSRDLSSWTLPVTHRLTTDVAPASSGLPDLVSSPWEYHIFQLEPSLTDDSKGFLRVKISEP